MAVASLILEQKALRRLALASVLLLGGCVTPSRVPVTLEPQGYGEKVPTSVLDDPKRLTEATDSFLQSNRAAPKSSVAAKAAWLAQWTDATGLDSRQRLAIAELATQVGLAFGEEPEKALPFYLQVCQFTQDEVFRKMESAGRDLAGALYNHACGQVGAGVRHLREASFAGRLTEKASAQWQFPSGYFDWLLPVDHLELGDDLPRVSSDGVGGALLGYRLSDENRLAENRNMAPPGFCLPLNVVVQVKRDLGGRYDVHLRWHDMMAEESMTLAGRRFPLAADYAIVYPDLLNRAPRGGGLNSMLRPEAFLPEMGLYCNGPIRMNKIPVIFVHGLMSHPETWKTMWGELIQDPSIRERYQFWAFMYPSGLPLMFSSGALTRELNALVEVYESKGKGSVADKMVMIGHSMGGLLSSIQVRRSDETVYQQLFRVPPDALEIDEESRQALRERFFTREGDYVRRAIFISTPHRGSSVADSALGRFGSSLIQLPSSVTSLSASDVAKSTTELGFKLFGAPGDGIKHLKENNLTLKTILAQPIFPGVSTHSIIGDRGIRDVPIDERSDGIVSYQSAHLDGIDSEKMVPTGHSSTMHPETIEEVHRILRLHVR